MLLRSINLKQDFVVLFIEVCILTCYFRHNQMKEVFTRVHVEVTKENRKEIDRIIHSIVGVEYKNCSATWRVVKEHLSEDEDAFVAKLKSAL